MFAAIKKRYLWPNILTSCILLCSITGCNHSKLKETKPEKYNFLTRVYTQKELDKILKKGMTPQEVIHIFGKPSIDDEDVYIYMLDHDKAGINEKNFVITGFSIIFGENKVVKWKPSYAICKKVQF